jgi:hypothetical protein
MFRPTTIVLALMSGGALVSIAPALMHDTCADARAGRLANAEEICARRGWGHGISGGWYSGYSGVVTRTGGAVSGTAIGTSGVTRGGFGSTGAAHASAGG